MRIAPLLLCTLLLPAALPAEELLRTISFADAARSGALLAGEVQADGSLRLQGGAREAATPLLELTGPGIGSARYAMKGMVRYEGLQANGYLEMNSHFGGRGTFFTRTLADTGPMRRLSGTADWRPFVLPFDASTGDGGESLVPEKLSLSLHLPGPGTVWLKDVALYQYSPGENPLQPAGQWFSDRSAALVGAIGGSLVGLWGGLVGLLSGRGRARGFVRFSVAALLVTGIVSLGFGIAAIVAGQPYAVFFPLLLIGGILVGVIGPLRGRLAARYEELELARMRSMDA